MRTINFTISNKKIWLFIETDVLLNISSFIGKTEKAGYLFTKKIKNANEFICTYFTPPHKKDLSTKNFVEISKKHKKISKKIRKNNPYLYEIGFYHTHPDEFGCEPSDYDLRIFTKKSNKYFISFFIISLGYKMQYFVYSYGKEIKKGVLWV